MRTHSPPGRPAGSTETLGDRLAAQYPMRAVVSLPILRVATLFAALTGSTPAAQYRQDYAAFDAGGGSSSSPNYSMVTSLVAIGGSVLAGGGATLRPGFIGQINDPPRVQTDLLYRDRHLGVKTRLAGLLANDRDPEGGPLTVVAFVATGQNGGQVRRDGDWLMYDPAEGEGGDQFQYVVADAEGDRSIGWVSVSVLPDTHEATRNLVGITPLPGGEVRVDFIGLPRRWYRVEWTENLEAPRWQVLGRVQAGPQGLFSFTELNQGGARFYRAIAE